MAHDGPRGGADRPAPALPAAQTAMRRSTSTTTRAWPSARSSSCLPSPWSGRRRPCYSPPMPAAPWLRPASRRAPPLPPARARGRTVPRQRQLPAPPARPLTHLPARRADRVFCWVGCAAGHRLHPSAASRKRGPHQPLPVPVVHRRLPGLGLSLLPDRDHRTPGAAVGGLAHYRHPTTTTTTHTPHHTDTWPGAVGTTEWRLEQQGACSPGGCRSSSSLDACVASGR